MLDKIAPIEKPSPPTLSLVQVDKTARNDDSTDVLSEAEIRRQMYERIARGNALAEVEENARREWHRR